MGAIGVKRLATPCGVEAQKRSLRTSPASFAVQQFKLADIGEGIAEVQVTELFVKEGDSIKEMDNVCAVESDKASVELTSPYSGKVTKLYCKLQDTVKVGAPIMDVEVAGDSPAPPTPAPTPTPSPAPSSSPTPAASGGGTETFKLADIGEGIAEVQITEWFVKEGDTVKEMDNLCAVESDKASVELTSPFSGKIAKIYHKVQETVKVGAPICDITTAGGATAPAPSATSTPAPAPTPTPAPAATGSAVQQFKLADIGEGIAQVQITELFVKEGDMVKEMDNLFAVESDKASVELTSPFTGKVAKLHYKTGDTVKVGDTLVDIETAGAAPVATPAAPTTPTPAPAVASTPTPAPSVTASSSAAVKAPGVLATPKVRGLAREKGINLNTVTGTGAGGRVLAEDVLAAVSAPEAAPSAAAPVAAAPTPTFAHVPRTLEDKKVDITDKVGKGMIKSMVSAMQQPFMALGEEIDVTDLFALQKALKEPALKKYGVKVTLTSFIIKAISLSLNEWPIINSKFGPMDATPNHYTQYGSHNITVAIDSPFGLVVPNIKDCGNLSVVEIQMELNRLVADAKAGKLSMKDMQGGTITFSNVGSIGTKDPRPILYDGQAVIGAAGRLMTLPRYDSKMQLVPRQVMNVRWVGDHRHLDGATLARFSNAFRRYMEDPGEWTLTLR